MKLTIFSIATNHLSARITSKEFRKTRHNFIIRFEYVFPLIFSLLILVTFHREIILIFILLFTGAREITENRHDILLSAQRKKAPKVFLFDFDCIETIVLSATWHSYAFVHQRLWNEWTEKEREAFVCWCHSALIQASPFTRLFFGLRSVESVDRDVGLLGGDPLALAKSLEKTWLFRAQGKSLAWNQFLSGLSFIGPSFLHDWPDHNQRLKSIARYLEKLQNRP